jgi:hypothetical protein
MASLPAPVTTACVTTTTAHGQPDSVERMANHTAGVFVIAAKRDRTASAAKIAR